jgi:AcrR family transcriptional regulator
MQELKETVRKAITDAAMQEFLKNGYEGASMRKIAFCSGITHGNIYRYFKNKEKLYQSLVEKSQSQFINLMQEILIPFTADIDVLMQLNELAEKLALVIINERNQLILLLERGPKNKVTQIGEKIIQMINRFFSAHISPNSPFGDEFFLNLTSSNIFKGFLEITRSNKDFEWTVRNLNLLIRYHLFGIASM